MEKIKEKVLHFAEVTDALRVVPRLLIVAYSFLVWELYKWYKSIPVYTKTVCNENIVHELTIKGYNIQDIAHIACTAVDTYGGPTSDQTLFVTTIIGLSTGIFGLYTMTGRKWGALKNE